MSDQCFNLRRIFLKAAASTGLATLGGAKLAHAFLGGSPKFEWLPSECADERYPMQLISGDLLGKDGVIAAVPAGKIINNGWGEIGSRRLIGPAQKAVPESLELSWFSFAEDKFFGGTVPLPQADLIRLFKEGFEEPQTGARVTWAKIIVGMGLGGWTSVWLAGSGIVREVARAQLSPTQIDWRFVLDNPALDRAEYIRSKLQARLSKADFDTLAKQGPAVATWPRYAQRYRWRMIAAGSHAPQHMFLRSFNGERQFYDFTRSPPEALETAPKHAQITWLTQSGSKLLTEIRFDESELFGALEKAKAATSNGSTLRVEHDARSRVSIVLESQAARIPLTRSRVDVSSLGK